MCTIFQRAPLLRPHGMAACDHGPYMPPLCSECIAFARISGHLWTPSHRSQTQQRSLTSGLRVITRGILQQALIGKPRVVPANPALLQKRMLAPRPIRAASMTGHASKPTAADELICDNVLRKVSRDVENCAVVSLSFLLEGKWAHSSMSVPQAVTRPCTAACNPFMLSSGPAVQLV